MKNLKQEARTFLSFLYSIGHLRPLRKGGRVLMYHSIEESVEMDPTGQFTVPLKYFKEHIKELIENDGWSLSSFSDCKSDKAGSISVTFDDGYRNNLTLAAPLLCESKIPFTVFISTDFIKTRKRDFLSPSELKELASLPGVTIGAHGVHHLRLTSLKEKLMIEELEESKKYLEDLLGKSITTMSYPFGDVNERVAAISGELGYEYIGTSRFDLNDSQTNSLLLNRCEINRWDNIKNFRSKLSGHWDWYRFR